MRRRNPGQVAPLDQKVLVTGRLLTHPQAIELLTADAAYNVVVSLVDGGKFLANIPIPGTRHEYENVYLVKVPQEVTGEWTLELHALETVVQSEMVSDAHAIRLPLDDIATIEIVQVMIGGLVFEAEPRQDGQLLYVSYPELMRIAEVVGWLTLPDKRQAEFVETPVPGQVLPHQGMTFDNVTYSHAQLMNMGYERTLPIGAVNLLLFEEGVTFYAVAYEERVTA